MDLTPTYPDALEPGRLHFRIRTRLALLAMALALPFAGYSVHASIEEARIERAHVAVRMLGVAQVTAARLDDHVHDIRSILRVISTVVSVDPAKAADNDLFLGKLADNIPAHLNNLTVWTASGENVGSLDPRLRGHGGTTTADRPFLNDAASVPEDGTSADAPVASLSNGALVRVFGLPIRRDGKVVGAVAATMRLGSLQQLLRAGADLPPSAVVTVIDARGIILARSIDPERWVGKSVKGVAVPDSGAAPGLGDDGVRDGPSIDGVARIAGFATVRSASWYVYVGVPSDEALAPVYAHLRGSLLTAGLMLLGGLLLATFVGEGIASPIRRLSRDAAELGAGDLAHRSRAGSGEVGVLARTLNQMAEQLQERTGALLMSQEQLRQVTNNLPALISYLDSDERFRFVNDVYETWLGHEPRTLIGKSLLELYGDEIYDGFKAHIHEALGGTRVSYERELDTLQGKRRVEVAAVPDVDPGGVVRGLFIMVIDVTARRDAEAALSQSERRLRMVADNMPALVTYVDRDERYRFVNAYHGNVFHTDPASLIGKTMLEICGERLYAETAPHVAAVLRGEEVVFQSVWVVRGRKYHYQSTYVPDVDTRGIVNGFYAMTFDISALKETQRKLDMLARVDSLTGLPNRRQFDERLHDAMARTRRTDIPLALMFLDIDHFKGVNDTLGHGAGDLVLKEFAARLRAQVRGTDIVARLAGDEFVILVEGIRGVEELDALAVNVIEAVREPLVLAHRQVRVTTSMGIATYDGGACTPPELLAVADRALYAAKRQGRDRFSLATQGSAEVLDLATVRGRLSGGSASS